MIAGSVSLDTSVVIRLLVGEPADQYRSANALLSDQLKAGWAVHVGDLVLAEAYFALQGYYQLSKSDALQALALFARHSGVSVSSVAQEVLALPRLATAKPGFVDRLIHGTSQNAGHTLVSFEKSAAKLPATLILAGA